MRISDWSSDVCSSDLADALQSKGNRLRHHVRRLRRPPQEGEIGGGREFSIAGHANSPCTYQRGCSLSRSCSPLRNTQKRRPRTRSEEHTSELQSLMRISYAVFCLKKKKNSVTTQTNKNTNTH